MGGLKKLWRELHPLSLPTFKPMHILQVHAFPKLAYLKISGIMGRQKEKIFKNLHVYFEAI